MKNIKITQIKSSIGRLPKHKKTLIGLGLRYIGHSVIHKNTSSLRGMIRKIDYILHTEEV
ncbi:MAG: 50S ribosomal protein L30 [Buchnera aphidicola]|nr:50S ribosomal protein L30 [Buchnera aphidicola]MDE5285299.1 50S ribosomal protein L30 [Buchnera aphidicola]